MARNSASDFQRDVAARSVPGKNKYVAVVNSDGTHQVNKNGVVLHPRVFWSGSGAVTDANQTGDRVTIFSPDGSVATADATVFLNSLN